MKSNRPGRAKRNSPDSDESARAKHEFASGEEELGTTADTSDEAGGNIEGLETSNKTGKHSTVEKLAASRPEFGVGTGARPVDGAYGNDPDHVISGRNAAPETSQFRCSGCGRFFDSGTELSQHERDCLLAKAATASGRDSLAKEDASPHPRNDAGR